LFRELCLSKVHPGNLSVVVPDLFLGVVDGLVSSIRFCLLKSSLLLVSEFLERLNGVLDGIVYVLLDVVSNLLNHLLGTLVCVLEDLLNSGFNLIFKSFSVSLGIIEVNVNFGFGLGVDESVIQ
jgi:hypothetical protein